MSNEDHVEALAVGIARHEHDEALYELIAPELGAWERTVRVVEPSLPDGEVLDRALRQALAHLRHEVAQQTLCYLRWRAEQARASAQAIVARSAAARAERAAVRQAAPDRSGARPVRTDAEHACAQIDEQRCAFQDGAGCVWTVHEVATGAALWAKGPRCLLFGSESAIRRVWRYPPDWRTLSVAELETLSWRV